jgi:hypothetical protein
MAALVRGHVVADGADYRGTYARALDSRTKTKAARAQSALRKLRLLSVCACYILRAYVHVSPRRREPGTLLR